MDAVRSINLKYLTNHGEANVGIPDGCNELEITGPFHYTTNNIGSGDHPSINIYVDYFSVNEIAQSRTEIINLLPFATNFFSTTSLPTPSEYDSTSNSPSCPPSHLPIVSSPSARLSPPSPSPLYITQSSPGSPLFRSAKPHPTNPNSRIVTVTAPPLIKQMTQWKTAATIMQTLKDISDSLRLFNTLVESTEGRSLANAFSNLYKYYCSLNATHRNEFDKQLEIIVGEIHEYPRAWNDEFLLQKHGNRLDRTDAEIAALSRSKTYSALHNEVQNPDDDLDVRVKRLGNALLICHALRFASGLSYYPCISIPVILSLYELKQIRNDNAHSMIYVGSLKALKEMQVDDLENMVQTVDTTANFLHDLEQRYSPPSSSTSIHSVVPQDKLMSPLNVPSSPIYSSLPITPSIVLMDKVITDAQMSQRLGGSFTNGVNHFIALNPLRIFPDTALLLDYISTFVSNSLRRIITDQNS